MFVHGHTRVRRRARPTQTGLLPGVPCPQRSGGCWEGAGAVPPTQGTAWCWGPPSFTPDPGWLCLPRYCPRAGCFSCCSQSLTAITALCKRLISAPTRPVTPPIPHVPPSAALASSLPNALQLGAVTLCWRVTRAQHPAVGCRVRPGVPGVPFPQHPPC